MCVVFHLHFLQSASGTRTNVAAAARCWMCRECRVGVVVVIADRPAEDNEWPWEVCRGLAETPVFP